ncbi:tyrosine-type recombinase/integrase [Bacillus sp. AFS040349]|uniref:tyrosine-type recombinase/integrase n=1 Tax=Bacillus sp. AFS040349 TaxID=2033502 RepID=UPI000BFD81A2|nr:tyrosine-type recombinase/integrase [Bacillus sp. AFS040349]PGT83290.1 integrase [Bacillus sp. AFS040349]
MKSNNELSITGQTYEGLSVINNMDIPELIATLNNKENYIKMLDVIDRNDAEDYTQFNDLEMIYLFVHHERDLDDVKNRTAGTKKEYLRELLQFYYRFIHNGGIYEFDVSRCDITTLLKSIKPRNIRKYQQWLKEAPLGKSGKPYSITTLARKTVVLKAFLSFLNNKGYITTPLHDALKTANVNRRDLPDRDLNSVEVIQLMAYYRDHPILYSLLAVLTTTGIRIQELCKTKMSDLSYDNGRYWLKVIGKGNVEREVLIHQNVFNTIKEFRKRRGQNMVLDKGDSSPIFTTAKGKEYNYKYLSNYITKAIRKTELPFVIHRKNPIGPHTLRHAYAIISAENGSDLLRISQSLGHKNVNTTMIYLEKTLARKNSASHSWANSDILNNI